MSCSSTLTEYMENKSLSNLLCSIPFIPIKALMLAWQSGLELAQWVFTHATLEATHFRLIVDALQTFD